MANGNIQRFLNIVCKCNGRTYASPHTLKIHEKTRVHKNLTKINQLEYENYFLRRLINLKFKKN